MPELKTIEVKNNLNYLSYPERQEFNETDYINLRAKEGRLYNDVILKNLPQIELSHPHKNEWDIRNRTLKNLIKYFSKRYKGIDILEVGCGNGWLANAISSKTNNNVFAIDLNETELLQGAKVFQSNKNLHFIYGNIFENIFPPNSFDTILFASSIQYFENFRKTIERSLYFLKPNGEIIIVDTNFYTENEVHFAKKRTMKYYQELGFPEFNKNYFHHTWNDLKFFNFKYINKFQVVLSSILRKSGLKNQYIFPWIIIRKII